MAAIRTTSACFGALAACAAAVMLVAATPARADWRGPGYGYRAPDRGGWHPGWGYRHWGGGPRWGVVVAPPAYYPPRRPYYPPAYYPPAYYARPPVYYAPPPVYYAPPPVVYAPGVAFGLTVR